MKNLILIVSIIVALGVGLSIGILINNNTDNNTNYSASNINLNASNTNSASDEYTETNVHKCVAAGTCCNCGWHCYEEINGVLNKGACPAFCEKYCSQEELNEIPKPNCSFVDKECQGI